MRRFVTLGLAFGALQSVLAGIVLCLGRAPTGSDYMSAAHDKQALLASIPTRKLVLIGGSNLAFGVDSPALQEGLGLPVVNLGLHASLGMGVMLRQAAAGLRRGDVVLVSMEYEEFGSPGYGEMYAELLAARSPLVRFFRWREYRMVADAVHVHVRNCLWRLRVQLGAMLSTRLRSAGCPPPGPHEGEVNVYSRQAFNRLGDVVAHHGATPARVISGGCRLSDVDRATLTGAARRLGRFAREQQARGVTVVYSFPPVLRTGCVEWLPVINRIAERVSCLPEVHPIDSPQWALWPADRFFDSAYHLNLAGKQERTKHLLAGMRCLRVGPQAR